MCVRACVCVRACLLACLSVCLSGLERNTHDIASRSGIMFKVERASIHIERKSAYKPS